MTQKVLKVGSSAAVTIPKKSLAELGLKIGDEVSVEVDARKKAMTVRPAGKLTRADERVAKLTFNFMERYGKDLQELAKK